MVTLHNKGASIVVPDDKAAYLESVGWRRQPEAKKAPKGVVAQPEPVKEEKK